LYILFSNHAVKLTNIKVVVLQIDQYNLGLFYLNMFILKIEQLLVQHLYDKKQVALQGIGIFKSRPDISFPVEGDKDIAIPPDVFSFEFNLKTTEDDDLVTYIVQQTGKIKPLASSDLESYALLAKQFLNLGKPFKIPGVGTVLKSQKGEYEFMPGQYINPKIEAVFKPLTERKEDEVSFERENVVNNKSRNLLIISAVLVVLFAGLGLYYFFAVKNNEAKPQEQVINIQKSSGIKDTSEVNGNNKVAAALPITNTTNNGTVNLIKPAQKDTANFSIVLKDYTTKKAVEIAYDKLIKWGHNVAIIRADSFSYKLVVPFASPLSDTLRAKDSLRKFFGGRPYVYLKK